jgi:hypothetical protein
VVLLLHWAALILVGVSIGHHFGPLDGFAAAFALYALIPYAPRGQS